jgi:predicted DNA-binding transcriptional regulator YafY
MNRIDRLFGILLLLQGKSLIRAQDLAEKFEVSRRTIYRDIDALGEMGVPVIALPGEGFSLTEGFYLPPLIFSALEASALFLGARLLSMQAAGKLPEAAEQALSKIANILPQETRSQVERLTDIIEFFTPEQRFNLDDPRLLLIQKAIIERYLISIRYHSYSQDEVTEREVEPQTLSYANGSWYINGYCRLRRDQRAFRLGRVEALKLLDKHFEPRPMKSQVREKVTVLIRFAKESSRWVHEHQHYGFQREERAGDKVVMVYELDNASEIKYWLLGWGANAEVLEPLTLREEIRREAAKMLDLLT